MKMINWRLAAKSCVEGLRLFSADSCNRERSLLVNLGRPYLEKLTSECLHGGGGGEDTKIFTFPMESPFFVSGPCRGLFCIYSNWEEVFLLNPATADIKRFPLPPLENLDSAEVHSVGLGFDHKTNDFKIVRSVTCNFRHLLDIFNPYRNYFRRESINCVEIFSLNSMQRKEIPVVGRIRNLRPSISSGVPYVDGVCYWVDIDRKAENVDVISFDFATERFDVFTLPPYDYLGRNPTTENCLIQTYNGLPAVIRHFHVTGNNVIEVWIKKKTWVREMTTGPIPSYIKPLSLWYNHGLILLGSQGQFLIYDLDTKQVNILNAKLYKPYDTCKEPIIIQVLNCPESLVPNP